jgi:hypothetical protein
MQNAHSEACEQGWQSGPRDLQRRQLNGLDASGDHTKQQRGARHQDEAEHRVAVSRRRLLQQRLLQRHGVGLRGSMKPVGHFPVRSNTPTTLNRAFFGS